MANILKVCIATTKCPTERTKQAFIDEVKGSAQDMCLRVSAILGREGRGCYNLGLKIEGDERSAKSFVDALTIALGPCSDWFYTTDEFEGVVFEDLRK